MRGAFASVHCEALNVRTPGLTLSSVPPCTFWLSGTSCTSISKQQNNRAAFKTCIADRALLSCWLELCESTGVFSHANTQHATQLSDDKQLLRCAAAKDSTGATGVTFAGALHYIREKRPPFAVFENVVGIIEQKLFVIEKFASIGYIVTFVQACPTDFGMPVRRPRVYMIATQADWCTQEVLDNIDNIYKSLHQPLNDPLPLSTCMLPDDHPLVIDELNRRRDTTNSSSYVIVCCCKSQVPNFITVVVDATSSNARFRSPTLRTNAAREKNEKEIARESSGSKPKPKPKPKSASTGASKGSKRPRWHDDVLQAGCDRGLWDAEYDPRHIFPMTHWRPLLSPREESVVSQVEMDFASKFANNTDPEYDVIVDASQSIARNHIAEG